MTRVSSPFLRNITSPARRERICAPNGFTLVEMAVVLIVIGLIILTVFPALTAMRASSQRSATQSNLQALMLATAAYVQANGCVPCPTPPGAISAAMGTVGVSGGTASCGTCNAPEGVPPFASLGLPASTAHDGWGHWITMRVDPALTANFNVTPPTTPIACTCTFNSTTNKCTASSGCSCPPPTGTTCPQPTNLSAQGLCAANISATSRISIINPSATTQQAAVIFVSHGMNGYGSYVVASASNHFSASNLAFSGNYPACPCTNKTNCVPGKGYAQCNADHDALYVNATYVSGGPDLYDDMVLFADRNMLVSMLGGGACQTAW